MKLVNVLPFDGEVYYHPKVFNDSMSLLYFDRLRDTIAWEQDQVTIFGKTYITERRTAWYGDKPFDYTYSRNTKRALPWTAELLELKAEAEKTTGAIFNSCLLNLYHHGDEGMGWHSDDEKTIVRNSAIASISFGAERKFSFRHRKTKETIYLLLANGSILSMAGATQLNWLHSLPKTKKVLLPRINLTFRRMVEDI